MRVCAIVVTLIVQRPYRACPVYSLNVRKKNCIQRRTKKALTAGQGCLLSSPHLDRPQFLFDSYLKNFTAKLDWLPLSNNGLLCLQLQKGSAVFGILNVRHIHMCRCLLMMFHGILCLRYVCTWSSTYLQHCTLFYSLDNC